MANQKISSPLVRSITGGHIATVNDISYTTETKGTGALAYEVIKESLKSKLDALDSAISELNEALTGESGVDSRLDTLEAKSYTVDTILYPETDKATLTLKEKIEALNTAIAGLGKSVKLSDLTYSYTEEGATEPTNKPLDEYLDIVREAISQITDISDSVGAAKAAQTAAESAEGRAVVAQNNSEEYSSCARYGYYEKDGTILAWKKGENWVSASDSTKTVTITPVTSNGVTTYTIGTTSGATFVKGVVEAQTEYATLEEEVNDLKSIAEDLAASYTTEQQFEICTQEYYDNLATTDTSTIYFVL